MKKLPYFVAICASFISLVFPVYAIASTIWEASWDTYLFASDLGGGLGAQAYCAPFTGEPCPDIMFFEKVNGADWTLAANQDMLSSGFTPGDPPGSGAGVTLTRGNNGGLFNIAQEVEFEKPQTISNSPLGTLWAFGSTADLNTDSNPVGTVYLEDFDTWADQTFFLGPALSAINENMIIYLVDEDIYLDFRLLTWQDGRDLDGNLNPCWPACGGFSYLRANGANTASVTVNSRTDQVPVVTAPADKTFEATGPETPVDSADLGTATAFDDEDGSLAVTADFTGPFPVGETDITWSATDTAGNTGTAMQTVTITDTTPPIVTPPADIEVLAVDSNGTPSGNSFIASFLSGATAVDLVDGQIAVVENDGPDLYPLGDTTVTFSAEDSRGNTAIPVTAVVTIVDVIDTDNDGIPDEVEDANELDPNDPNDAALDFDGDGLTNLEEFQLGTDIRVDSVKPVLTIPSDRTVNATGPFTPVDLGVATAVDFLDGLLEPSPDNTGPFAPGRHVVTWSVMDAAGNEAIAEQIISVRPMADFVPSQFTGEGVPVSVGVYLSGEAAQYPVSITYTVSGTASIGADYTFDSGTIEIEEGTEGSLTILVLEDGETEADETIILEMDPPTNASSGPISVHTITITEQNRPPMPVLTIEQAGSKTSSIVKAGGPVVMSVAVSDPNPGDDHSYNWSGTNSSLVPDEGLFDSSFTFDPSGLDAGVYLVDLTVTDTGIPAESARVQRLIRVVSTAPDLRDDMDMDGDGVSDQDEGAGDTDGDGIPDYLDAIDVGNLLQGGIPGRPNQLLITQPGLILVQGQTSFASNNPNSRVTLDDIENNGGTGGGLATGVIDSRYSYALGLFDFEVHNLPVVGISVPVVITLDGPLERGAVYRKFQPASGWQNFIVNARNAISSAPGQDGVCPAPGDASYEAGLLEGYNCIQLLIEDGGPNDASDADGVIRDPGGATVPPLFISGSSGGGGGGGCALGRNAKPDITLPMLAMLSLFLLLAGRRERISK